MIYDFDNEKSIVSFFNNFETLLLQEDISKKYPYILERKPNTSKGKGIFSTIYKTCWFSVNSWPRRFNLKLSTLFGFMSNIN